jgi:hypothetical protein
MPQNSFLTEMLSLLFVIPHTIVTWHRPTSRILGHIKASLADRVFNDADELLEAIIEFFNEIQSSELQLVFHHWIERVKWVLANNEDYYHE